MPIKLIPREKITKLDKIVFKLTEKLTKNLGDLVVLVESIDGWDGSNVRIVLKKVDTEIINKVLISLARSTRRRDMRK